MLAAVTHFEIAKRMISGVSDLLANLSSRLKHGLEACRYEVCAKVMVFTAQWRQSGDLASFGVNGHYHGGKKNQVTHEGAPNE